jgi:septum formation protein
MKQNSPILLASGSPRRSELLSQAGIDFRVVVTDVDETRQGGESPESFVKRLAAEKALAGLHMSQTEMPVLGADTVVLLDDRILGKPASRQDAADMLRMMSNRGHQVLTAVALANAHEHVEVVLNSTRVVFDELPESFISWYTGTNEPMDKAGAYAIQGSAGQFISRVEGSYSGVMGLPLYETSKLLRVAGIIS